MLTIRTILHPTDFSECSAYAFRLACSLAQDYGAQLIVAHVIPPLVSGYIEAGPYASDRGELERRVRGNLVQLRPPDPSARVEYRLYEGDPASEIIRLAQDTHADLIVMGAHGRTWVGRLLMGSVAEGVSRRAPCPVLTVKTTQREPSSDEEAVMTTAGEAAGEKEDRAR